MLVYLFGVSFNSDNFSFCLDFLLFSNLMWVCLYTDVGVFEFVCMCTFVRIFNLKSFFLLLDILIAQWYCSSKHDHKRILLWKKCMVLGRTHNHTLLKYAIPEQRVIKSCFMPFLTKNAISLNFFLFFPPLLGKLSLINLEYLHLLKHG